MLVLDLYQLLDFFARASQLFDLIFDRFALVVKDSLRDDHI